MKPPNNGHVGTRHFSFIERLSSLRRLLVGKWTFWDLKVCPLLCSSFGVSFIGGSTVYREKVKAEIAKDRAERAAREKLAKAEGSGGGGGPPLQQPLPATTTAPQAKKEYDICRLQVK